jgi:hypothetical protein
MKEMKGGLNCDPPRNEQSEVSYFMLEHDTRAHLLQEH